MITRDIFLRVLDMELYNAELMLWMQYCSVSYCVQ